jgi:small ligand-binding sensory domain FIST
MARSPAFSAACSTLRDTRGAVSEVCAEAMRDLGGTPDLGFVFFSADHIAHGEELAGPLCEALGTDQVIGCSGESIVSTAREWEGTSAVSLWLARLPGVRILPMHLEFARTPEGGSISGWPDGLPDPWPATSCLLALGDPFSFPAELLLDVVNGEHRGVAVVGGMASAAAQPGDNLLICGRRTSTAGCAAVLVDGAVRVATLVSQGCRPIGDPFVVTKAEGNVILQLGGKPAYQRLVEMYQTLATREQALLRRGLHLGRVVSEYQDRFEQGDFLVRNVVGVDQDSGAVAIGDYIRAGQTVRFHVRDGETADGELRQLLARARPASDSPRGALLFTCNGRGTRLFSESHHDAGAVAEAWGDIPLAGFFAAGELGPIGGRNFIHGFTASLALFEPA